MPVLQPVQPESTNQHIHQKVSRKSSKPIFNWLQRKLGGTQRNTRRATVDIVSSKSVPKTVRRNLQQQQQQPEEVDLTERTHSVRPSSVSLTSSWRNSNTHEADEDASIRPIPPTSPPSPVPSRSSSSFVSDPRTFKSTGGASTKATTLLSIDMGGANGMAHIAQAPSTPNSLHNYSPAAGPPFVRVPSPRTSGSISSLNPMPPSSVTFSALPPSSPSSVAVNSGRLSGFQAPLHTKHHPRNNPRPSSPPLDDASILTLASSAYATTARYGWGGDSQSQIVDSASHTALDELQIEERDINASVRALRPRSSRRGSWDSEASGWSANSPIAADKSVRTAPSLRANVWGPNDDDTTDGGEEDNASSLKRVPPTETGSVEGQESLIEDHGTPAVRPQTLV